MSINKPLAFSVPGIPRPQGSKTYLGKGRMKESSPHLAGWREAIMWIARKAAGEIDWRPGTNKFVVDLVFAFPRPQTHYRSVNKQPVLRDDAPLFYDNTPDVDKLIRAVFDSLTLAGVWGDDKRAVGISARKVYATHPGVNVVVTKVVED
jgi:Holliday junction resolvase RusA-like endonuclease